LPTQHINATLARRRQQPQEQLAIAAAATTTTTTILPGPTTQLSALLDIMARLSLHALLQSLQLALSPTIQPTERLLVLDMFRNLVAAELLASPNARPRHWTAAHTSQQRQAVSLVHEGLTVIVATNIVLSANFFVI
jgi:hypothetical protein